MRLLRFCIILGFSLIERQNNKMVMKNNQENDQENIQVMDEEENPSKVAEKRQFAYGR